MLENISILIINSSHKSIDIITSILKAKILSKQRPNIAYLSCEEFKDKENLESFLQTFLNREINECQEILEKERKKREFNQLEVWKNEVNRKRSSKRLKSEVKNKFFSLESNNLLKTILDSPNEDDFYLILFDVYDCELIKSIASFEQSLLMGLVNLYPRHENDSYEDMLKCENFWDEILKIKHKKDFENVAFIDMDVPIESNCILKLRSQLIYDQFCHSFYDFQQSKLSYKLYYEHLFIQDVSIQMHENDFKQFQKRLDEVHCSMLSIEDIYEAIIQQIAKDDINNSDRNSFSILNENSLRKIMEIEAYGIKFYDINDAWRKGYTENPKFYSHKIQKLEKLCDDFWSNINMKQSIEQKQILYYFMNKIIKRLSCNEKVSDFVEFYFYVLQFKNWHCVEDYTKEDKEFYEIRSVGCKRMKNDKRYSRKVTSDTCIGYRNTSGIPTEIEKLMSTKVKVNEMENFNVQVFSRSAMLQHINRLMETRKNFYRQYSNIFDILLLKFSPSDVPEIFSSKSYRKTLLTPLCFRDYNDYKKYEMVRENFDCSAISTKIHKNCHGNGSFILPTSIKFQQNAPFENNEQLSWNQNTKTKIYAENSKKKGEMVYNVCNAKMEFQIEEIKFQSFQLDVKSLVFKCVNYEKHLNFSCTLHDKIHLSYSYDLHTTNGFNNITLRDEHATGMICSIDIGHTSQNDNIILSFPHGMIIKIIDVDTLEMEHSHDMSINNVTEIKRTYFSNGFIMIKMPNGTFKVYSSNGTIFEIECKKGRAARKNTRTSRYEELTKAYKFSIASIHFLKKYMDISTFVMTTVTGNRFIVENDWIVDEIKPLCDACEYYNEVDGNFQIIRRDGLKILHTNSYTKCLYADGSVITKTFFCNDNEIATIFDSKEIEMRKPISILDEIWLTEAQNEIKFLMDDILSCVNDEYFMKINQFCLFEHKKYGSIQFMKNGIEMRLFNGIIVTKRFESCSVLFDDISFIMNNSKIEFFDEKCSECCNQNKVVINLQTKAGVSINEDNDEYMNEALISANDVYKNLFEVKRNGRQVFYEKWMRELCEKCEISRREYDTQKYGERWIVLNHDMSGCEIFQRNPNTLYNHINPKRKTWMETDDTLLLCCHDDIYEINIENDCFVDFKVEKDDKTTEENSISSSSCMTLNKSSTDLLVKTSHVNKNINNKKHKRKSKHSLRSKSCKLILDETENVSNTTSPWITPNESSICPEIINEGQMIQFYVNPLINLPRTLNVSAHYKLNKKMFNDIAEGMFHLRKSSCEKFIINADGLMKPPTERVTFHEHFKFIVKRSIEGYIREKLEQFRWNMARMIVNDLLETAFGRFSNDDPASSISRISINQEGLQQNSADESVPTIPQKSFSFI